MKYLSIIEKRKSISKKIRPAMIDIPPNVRPTGYPKRIKTITTRNKISPAASITQNLLLS